MFIKKLKCIFLCIVMILSSTMLFSGCNTDDEFDTLTTNMPDIVFVMYHYYPLEREYKTGNFIGTSGYYIEKTGEIKYFEFEDEKPAFDYDKMNITIEEYSDSRDVKNFHKKIVENSFDTEYGPVKTEELADYYKALCKINKQTKLHTPLSVMAMVYGLTCFYGITTDDEGNEEYIYIYEFGNESYYTTDNKYTSKMAMMLDNFLMETEIYYDLLHLEH